jgi:hypothetical protein
MSLLPADLQNYSSIVTIVLLFADGLIFGVAAKKAVTSVILIIIGLVVAAAIGLSIPFLSVNNVWTHVFDILASQARQIGPILYGFPVFWMIGFALGIWKG